MAEVIYGLDLVIDVRHADESLVRRAITRARRGLRRARRRRLSPSEKLARIADVFVGLRYASECIDSMEKREQA